MRKFLYYLAFVAESLRFVTPLRVAPVEFEQKKRFCQKYAPILAQKRAKKVRPQRMQHK